MHKDFVPPVSVEEFAAYLDYNLAADEMQSIDIALSQDESLRQLATLSDEAWLWLNGNQSICLLT